MARTSGSNERRSVHTVKPPVSDDHPRFSDRLPKVVAYENQTTGGITGGALHPGPYDDDRR